MQLKKNEIYWIAEADMFESNVMPIRVVNVVKGGTWVRAHIVFTNIKGNLQKDTIMLERKDSVISDKVSGYHNRRIFTSNNGACKWVVSELNRHIDHLKEEQAKFKSRIIKKEKHEKRTDLESC